MTQPTIPSKTISESAQAAPCPNCGTLLPMDAQTCSKCGATFGVGAAWKLGSTELSDSTPCATANRACPKCGSANIRRRTSGITVIGVFVVLVIVLLLTQGSYGQAVTSKNVFIEAVRGGLVWMLIIGAIAWLFAKNRCNHAVTNGANSIHAMSGDA